MTVKVVPDGTTALFSRDCGSAGLARPSMEEG